MASKTIKDATFDVLRAYGLTTMFANPGSTEVPFLVGLPPDLRFVLGLHEAAVVGTATGYALASGRPALVLLHTTAGYGNAVNAIATARTNRAPLVVVVGQQDRRHLRNDPFLAGWLDGLAGEYPVWQAQPPRPQDVPSYLARAWHEAQAARGPAVVVVPMDDWDALADDDVEIAAPHTLRRGTTAAVADVDELAALVDRSRAPAVVAGAGNDTPEGWAALVELAEVLGCPVWQEAFGARAGFPQDHRCFAGHLPAGRGALRAALSGHDLVLAVGAPVFRQYPYEPGRFVAAGTRLALLTAHPDEAHHSPVDLAVVADPADTLCRLAGRLRAIGRAGARRPVVAPASNVSATADRDDAVAPRSLYSELACRLPADVVLVEESPSSRQDLHELLPARTTLGFFSAAMGGLGFALPAAVGLKMALPERPVVAMLGDGSSLYAVQGLWTAAHYGVGVLFVVLANGRYAIMDRLNAAAGSSPPAWPGFGEISISTIARGLGCPAERVEGRAALKKALDHYLPDVARLAGPLVLEVAVTSNPREMS